MSQNSKSELEEEILVIGDIPTSPTTEIPPSVESIKGMLVWNIRLGTAVGVLIVLGIAYAIGYRGKEAMVAPTGAAVVGYLMNKYLLNRRK